eukprot:9210387-Lingulodinium_polyedra.AAC.1
MDAAMQTWIAGKGVACNCLAGYHRTVVLATGILHAACGVQPARILQGFRCRRHIRPGWERH